MASTAERIAAVVGAANVVTDPAELLVYEADGLTHGRTPPAMVVLPGSTAEVVEVVRIARDAGMPLVPRGAGTGLSGGARPVEGCAVVSLTRMRRILEVDLANGWVRVEPGVINLDVTKAVAGAGWYYAPDPSSQSVCSIGGNVAENSGGVHCLKYGLTTNNLLGLEVVLVDGAAHVEVDDPGLHPDPAVREVHLEDPPHPREGDDHRALDRAGATGEAGPGAAGDDGGPLLARNRDDPRHLFGRAREHHERRSRAAVREPVCLVDEQLSRIGEHVRRAHHLSHPRCDVGHEHLREPRSDSRETIRASAWLPPADRKSCTGGPRRRDRFPRAPLG